MKKVAVFSTQRKKDHQQSEETLMTGGERLELGFRLIEAAMAMSPSKQFPPPAADSIQCIDLK